MRPEIKNAMILSSLVLLAGCSSGPLESTGEGAALAAAPAPDPAAEEANVRQALDRFFAAAERKDWQTIDGLLAEDFEFYSDGTMMLDRGGFLEAMKDDSMDITSLELNNVQVTLSGDAGMAWVKYQAAMESSIHGEPYNMASAETVVFRKESSGWKMTHNHASVKELS